MRTDLHCSESTGATASTRDMRVDLVRGMALLIIFSDHIVGNPFRKFMPISLGFSDMAEVFIFVSGYLNGISSSARASQLQIRSSLVRCLRLYWTVALMHLLAMGLLATARSCGLTRASIRSFSLPHASTDPTIWQWTTLQSMLINSSVLGLYMILLAIMPLVRQCTCDRPVGTMLASGLIYCTVQVWPQTFSLPLPWAESIYFNPLAWQLLFVLGLARGIHRNWCRRFPPHSIVAIMLAICGLELGFLVQVNIWSPPFDLVFDKPTLAPLRLVHFFCVLILGHALLQHNPRLAEFQLMQPIIGCGEHSLVTYVAGGILAIVATMTIRASEPGWAWSLVINLCGWVLCMLIANMQGCFRGGRNFFVHVVPAPAQRQ